ncbi:MAG: ATP-binding protein [Candidatus Parabeggiatoa sp. nov. 2]|nr:MAG: hypothetical protein B6247_25830 [Beggiatoa sp. 4572_84]RKZ53446.1 MAG: ATP-binding protein [Gammaproteobacteria bacterium]
MTLLSFNRATTLKEAFHACPAERALTDGDEIEKYYVDLSQVRTTEAIEGVSSKLDFLTPGEYSTILFTGHRGCGKTTELKRIQSRWEKEYLVIFINASEEIDINDVSYTDLYLVIIKQVESELRRLDIHFDAKLLESFESWFKETTKETEETVEKSIGITASIEGSAQIPFIAKLWAKLLSQIKGSNTQRITIRQTLEQGISRLKAGINLLLGDGTDKLRRKFPQYKGLLIILDTLDRVPPHVGDHLFFDYAAQLQELNCTIIYTVPISALYSAKHLSNTFGSPNIVPSVNIYELDRQQVHLNSDQKGLEAIASLIERRVEVEAIFESRQQLLELAKASSGHVRQLMTMMQTACLTAHGRGHTKLTAEDIDYAIKQEQFNFERSIPNQHYPLIAQVCLDKNMNKDEESQIMLFGTSVLEYNGKERWNYVNSLVKKIDAFQKALQSTVTSI